MMAAAALAFAACTSENEILQNDNLQKAVGEVPVAFDTYLSTGTSAKTRAAYTNGEFDKDALNENGFGIFAYQHRANISGATDIYKNIQSMLAPNFMYNQQITWDGTNKVWTYSPLLYWPNQTVQPTGNDQTGDSNEEEFAGTDAQTGNNAEAPQLDRVSFFAYAPYVALTTAGSDDAAPSTGSQLNRLTGEVLGGSDVITDANNVKLLGNIHMTSLTQKGVPYIQYVASPVTDKVEDLLWGVAPYGGLKYTAVNQTPIVKQYGTPLTDLIKPDVNTRIKFLFQHALTGLRMKILASIDGKNTAGVGQNLDGNTKVSVNYITITSCDDDIKFATKGKLNLLNVASEGEDVFDDIADRPNIPNWNVAGADEKATLIIADPTIDLSKAVNYDENPDGNEFSGYKTKGPDFILNPQLYLPKDDTEDDIYTGSWSLTGVTEDEVSVFAKWTDLLQDAAEAGGKWMVDAANYDTRTHYDNLSAANENHTLMFIPVIEDASKITFDNAPALDVYVTIDYDIITKSNNFTNDVKQGYVTVHNKIRKKVSLSKFRNGRIYDLKLILGLTSVKVEAEANEWTVQEQEIDLPRNLD
jgi:hypothetical protein